MSGRAALLGLALLALASLAQPGAAQARPDALQSVQEMIAGGRFTAARTALERWRAQHPPGSSDATAEQRAHAMLLQARLAMNAAEAEDGYRSLVLSYPSSAHAAEALLRLGQALLAAGETARAISYLQRLLTEHPTSPLGATTRLWLARARGASGDWPGACQTTREALATSPADQELAGLLRTEEEAACTRPAEPAYTRPASPGGRGQEETARESNAGAQSGAYTVQIAAMRNHANADALAARLRRSGFDARVVVVPTNDLLRVRVGRHTSTQDAASEARRLRDAGYEAMVVDDARTERNPAR